MSNLISGKAYWFKAAGAPVPMYEQPKDTALVNREWSFDLSVDKAVVKELKKLGLADKVKNRGDDRGDFITFKRRAVKADNVTPNSPIRIVDHHGKRWNSATPVGNGSSLNVRFNVYEGRRGKKPAVLAVQVWDLVEYQGGGEDFPIAPEAEAAEEVPF